MKASPDTAQPDGLICGKKGCAAMRNPSQGPSRPIIPQESMKMKRIPEQMSGTLQNCNTCWTRGKKKCRRMQNRLSLSCCTKLAERSIFCMKSITQSMKHLQSLMSSAEKYGAKAAGRKRNRARSFLCFWRKRRAGVEESLRCRSKRPHSHPNQRTENERGKAHCLPSL